VETPSPVILLVDDDDFVRNISARILTEAGYRVSAARNGLEALEQLYQSCPDLLITDSTMPELDGTALIREARSRFPDLPIVRVSGSFGASGVRDDLPGDIVTLDKPFDPDELVALVARKVGRPGA
jgi:chemosensory pili system protein ChpA (sensor histidine kinase/response regulator)